jgi:hypothetical protein
MNHKDISAMFLNGMKELTEHTSNDTTTAILADAYLRLVRVMTTCESNPVDPDDPLMVAALGALAYHFHKYPMVYENKENNKNFIDQNKEQKEE